MKLAAPVWLAVLPLWLAALAILWRWSAARARAALQGAFNTPLLPRLLRSVDPMRRRGKQALFGAGIAALALALARPQWGRSEIEVVHTGVDLVIALDVSRSMLAADAGGTNRLAAAVGAIRRLLEELGGDRIALVTFAGEAFLSAPLTRDHVAIERALGSAGPGTVSRQGSHLGEAIQRAREGFEGGARGPRALLVVSDGEQLEGNAVEAARAAAREGIRVHTAGVGSLAGARVPRWSRETGGFLRNAAGREVLSRRDEQHLQAMALAGGGQYVRIDEPDSRALQTWFRQASASLPRTTEKRATNEPREQFQWPLALTLCLLAAEWRLSDRRRRRPDQTPTTS